jgi:hypothetical protein
MRVSLGLWLLFEIVHLLPLLQAFERRVVRYVSAFARLRLISLRVQDRSSSAGPGCTRAPVPGASSSRRTR